MTPDDDMLMAYADGELGPIERARVDRAIAADPSLGDRVAAHQMLRAQLGAAFAPVEQNPVPAHLTAMLSSNVVPIGQKAAPARSQPRWRVGIALAASLVLGVGLGTRLTVGDSAPVAVENGKLVASGGLAKALDTQLASTSGETRVLVSFRSAAGYCRVFASPATDGIACRDADHWQIRQTRAAAAQNSSAYRQAGSADAALMSAAQDMMQGEPLDEQAEQHARSAGWR